MTDRHPRPWAQSQPGHWCLFVVPFGATDGRYVSLCGEWARWQLDDYGREVPPEDGDVCADCRFEA